MVRFSAKILLLKLEATLFFLRSSNQSAWQSLYIPNLGRGDATIIIDQTNQTINGNKTFSQVVTMNQEGSASNHLVTKSYVDTHSSNNNYVKTDGSSFMSGDLNMNEQRVENMLDPVNEQDAVNRRYLESQLNDYLKRDGQSPMTFNLDMNNYKIVNLKNYNPNNHSAHDVPNLKYIDDYFVSRRSGILQDNLNANNNKIINLTYPTNIEDATNKQYVDQNFLNIDGNNNTTTTTTTLFAP